MGVVSLRMSFALWQFKQLFNVVFYIAIAVIVLLMIVLFFAIKCWDFMACD